MLLILETHYYVLAAVVRVEVEIDARRTTKRNWLLQNVITISLVPSRRDVELLFKRRTWHYYFRWIPVLGLQWLKNWRYLKNTKDRTSTIRCCWRILNVRRIMKRWKMNVEDRRLYLKRSLVLSRSRMEFVKRWKTTAKSVNLFDAYLCPIFTLFKFQVIDLRNSSADRSVDYVHLSNVGCTWVGEIGRVLV